MCQCGPGNRVFTELECVLAAGQICANAPNCDEACSAGALGYSNAHDDPDPTVWNEGLQCVHKK